MVPSRGRRVLIFHGYLLRGTGSNIYTANLARHLVALGHEVHLLCQDHEATRLDFVDAIGRWRGGRLRVEVLRSPIRCTVYLPDIGGLLPVYVADHYDGFVARTFPELTDEEIGRYIAANVMAVQDVAARFVPDLALANHLVMGPAILARALAGRIPYAVKIHGSALEYTVRPHRERFQPYAREGLAGAVAVLVGSAHTAESMYEVTDMPGLRERTQLLPPGVDAAVFRRSPPATARRRLRDLADRLERVPASWGGETGAAAALRAIDPDLDRVVTYVGKLIPAKGVDLLIAAWPLVVARIPRARLVITGFGTYRETLGELVRALGAGDLVTARRITDGEATTVAGRLRYVAAFLDEIADSTADRGRPRQTEADRGRPRQTEADRGRPRQTEADRGRPRQTEADRGRNVHSRRFAGDGPGPLHRRDRPYRPARPVVRIGSAGRPEHVPGGVRHGCRRGRVLWCTAAVLRAFRAGGGDVGARARAGRGPASADLVHSRTRRGHRDRRQTGPLAGAGPGHPRTGRGGAGGRRRGPFRLGPGRRGVIAAASGRLTELPPASADNGRL